MTRQNRAVATGRDGYLGRTVQKSNVDITADPLCVADPPARPESFRNLANPRWLRLQERLWPRFARPPSAGPLHLSVSEKSVDDASEMFVSFASSAPSTAPEKRIGWQAAGGSAEEGGAADCVEPKAAGIPRGPSAGLPDGRGIETNGKLCLMSKENIALIVGATGLSGSYAARHLKAEGWTVVTLSRSAADLPWSDRHIAADLEDASGSAEALTAASDVTHVFFCTWSRQKSEEENVRVNALMIRNLFDGLEGAPIKHAALVTGLKHYLGSFDDYAKVKPYTPFLESSPRLPGLNFYYAQEDVLFEMAAKRGFTWTVHRPHTMIGFVVGNAMNMAVTLAVYASICKHTGAPFTFPGSPEQYNAVADVTDARILAKQLHWAATTGSAANMPFNTVNGDLFRWTWLWAQIADYFGLPVGDYPGHAQPLEAQMADAPAIWAEIVARHGLQDIPVGKLASWWHTDADLGRTLECFTDMTNSRTRGFAAYQQSSHSFFDVFDELRARRIIPS